MITATVAVTQQGILAMELLFVHNKEVDAWSETSPQCHGFGLRNGSYGWMARAEQKMS